MGITPGQTSNEIIEAIDNTGLADKLSMIYLETPANPTNHLFDIEGLKKKVIDHYSKKYNNNILMAVDNTYMGPIWQHPLQLGADIVLYSATKYIGGHSDVIAGAVLANKEIMNRVKTLRTFLGNMISPYTAWLLLRSLETLKLRMDKQAENAQKVADFLKQHKQVEKVYYLGHLEEGTSEYSIYKNQCSGPGAMVSFDIKGGEKQAFEFLNNLKLIKLAVSLGSTESLAQHPYTMTHAGVDQKHRDAQHITDKMVRLSIGVENATDIINDLTTALNSIPSTNLLDQKLVLN